MSRSVSLLTVLALATSACTMTSGAKTATIGTGIALGIAGYAVMQQGPVDADNNGKNEWLFDDNFGAYFLGTALVLGGIAAFVGGVSSHEPEAPATVTPMPSASIATTSAYSPAEPRRLPELPASPEVLQLAQQVRSLGEAQQCHAAWATWRQLDGVDHLYAKSSLSLDIMGPCTGFEQP